jgi:hypothetical protein
MSKFRVGDCVYYVDQDNPQVRGFATVTSVRNSLDQIGYHIVPQNWDDMKDLPNITYWQAKQWIYVYEKELDRAEMKSMPGWVKTAQSVQITQELEGAGRGRKISIGDIGTITNVRRTNENIDVTVCFEYDQNIVSERTFPLSKFLRLCHPTEAAVKSPRVFNVGEGDVYYKDPKTGSRGHVTITAAQGNSYHIIPRNWDDMVDIHNYENCRLRGYIYAYGCELIKENGVNTELCDKRRKEHEEQLMATIKEGTIMDTRLMSATTIDTTKNDKRIKASARYSRATFWGAVILTSGAGQYVWSKAPVVLHAFGEFLVNMSGK